MNGKQTSETFAALRDAKAFRDKVRSNRAAGLFVDLAAGKTSLSEYAGGWLATAKTSKRPATYGNLESNLRLHILPVLGGKSLRSITRQDVQDLVNSLAVSLKPRTVLGIYETLVAVLRCAHLLDQIIGHTPCVGIDLPAIPKRKVPILTTAEIGTLAGAIDKRWAAAVIVAVSTGLRRSELLGLTWDRIDLEAGMVTVDRQLHSDGRRLAPVKTRHSTRVVPLSAVAVRALKAHQKDHPSRPVTLEHTDGYTEHGALVVFASRTGKPVHASWLGEVFRRARKAVGLPEAVTFHTLRHTFASILIAQGRSARAVQDRMGHGSITVTMDIYGHLFPDEDAKSRDAIDTGLSGLTW